MRGKILVTGGKGLVGTDLVDELQVRYGRDSVICCDLDVTADDRVGIYEQIDVRNKTLLEDVVKKHEISQIYHLAGLLSVGGEKNPELAWEVNVGGLKNVLDLAVKYKLHVFWPSSIAVFGPTTPRQNTPQHTILEPTTIYGATKVTGELLCQYYFLKYGVDVRSLRYPGLIAWKAKPGDGTTEYAVHIFHEALKKNKYTCFLKSNTRLPMMYIDDAIEGTIKLMTVDSKTISIRTSYNFSAMSFTPQELVDEISRHHLGFECEYQPDYRQQIADTWPMNVDDIKAREDWGWKEKIDIKKLVQVMFENLSNTHFN